MGLSRGHSLVDILDGPLRRHELYMMFDKWMSGYCLHSDWIVSFLVHKYRVSDYHDDADHDFDYISRLLGLEACRPAPGCHGQLSRGHGSAMPVPNLECRL